MAYEAEKREVRDALVGVQHAAHASGRVQNAVEVAIVQLSRAAQVASGPVVNNRVVAADLRAAALALRKALDTCHVEFPKAMSRLQQLEDILNQKETLEAQRRQRAEETARLLRGGRR